MKPDALTWAVMLGLVSATATMGCSKTPAHKPGMTSEPPGHPCHGKGNCDAYLRLPDGGAAVAPADGITDAGIITMCGPCNG